MAIVLTGAGGTTWRAADWVARNAFGFLVPALARAGAATLADRCSDALAAGSGGADVRDLDDPRLSHRWTLAVEAAVEAIVTEGPERWNEPERYEQFVARTRALGGLAHRDGNALLAALADATEEKIERGTP